MNRSVSREGQMRASVARNGWMLGWLVVLVNTNDDMFDICFEIEVEGRILKNKYSLSGHKML